MLGPKITGWVRGKKKYIVFRKLGVFLVFLAVVCCRSRELAERCIGLITAQGRAHWSLPQSPSPPLCSSSSAPGRSRLQPAPGRHSGYSAAGSECACGLGSSLSCWVQLCVWPRVRAGLSHVSDPLVGVKCCRPARFSPWYSLCLPHCSPRDQCLPALQSASVLLAWLQPGGNAQAPLGTAAGPVLVAVLAHGAVVLAWTALLV